MRKILVAGSAALFAAMAFAASPLRERRQRQLPSAARHGRGPGWGPGYGGGGIYVGGPYGGHNSAWHAHVDWCFDHKGPSYIPNTNTYINKPAR